jgi:hypothetical protein
VKLPRVLVDARGTTWRAVSTTAIDVGIPSQVRSSYRTGSDLLRALAHSCTVVHVGETDDRRKVARDRASVARDLASVTSD